MPPIKNSQDLFAAIAAIWTAIGEGRLTPDEASALSVVVDRSIQAIERHDVVTRITALEEAQEKREKRDKKAKNDDPVLSVLKKRRVQCLKLDIHCTHAEADLPGTLRRVCTYRFRCDRVRCHANA
jgi:hypothetical protein